MHYIVGGLYMLNPESVANCDLKNVHLLTLF